MALLLANAVTLPAGRLATLIHIKPPERDCAECFG
jgi:hypothetical protein